MNPDTKLTDEQARAICAAHNIPYTSHERITTGFSHEVHRINHDLIIKLFNGDEIQKFRTESGLLTSTLPILKPRLVASAQNSREVDRPYILMSFVSGMSLGSHWHEATDAQRENLIKSICQSLRLINRVIPAEIGLDATKPWHQMLTERSNGLLATLQSEGIISDVTADKIRKRIGGSKGLLGDIRVYPVYWDIHFDNFIVNEKFELQAIIDLENVELTSLDYPLFVVQRQMEEPHKYLREEDEYLADKKDYEKLRGWYQKYYPEMFDYRNLDERVKIYQLLDTLHLLIDWAHVQDLHEKLAELVAEE